MHVEISIIIAVVGAVVSFVTFVLGRSSASKADGRETGHILSEMGYLKSGIDDIKDEFKEQRRVTDDLNIRMTTTEHKLETAFKRIDELRG